VRKEADDLKDRENSGECSRDEAERYISRYQSFLHLEPILQFIL
jgi:hypothetical protein